MLQLSGTTSRVPVHRICVILLLCLSLSLTTAFGQSIALEIIDGRYFARRTRTRAAHRRRT